MARDTGYPILPHAIALRCFDKICETMLLNSNEPSNAFLIDNLKIKKL